MFSYILRRLVFGAVTVIAVSMVVFAVMRILPGDPLVAIFGPEGFTKLSEQERAHYMAELGLSDPLWLQYLNWVRDIARIAADTGAHYTFVSSISVYRDLSAPGVREDAPVHTLEDETVEEIIRRLPEARIR